MTNALPFLENGINIVLVVIENYPIQPTALLLLRRQVRKSNQNHIELFEYKFTSIKFKAHPS